MSSLSWFTSSCLAPDEGLTRPRVARPQTAHSPLPGTSPGWISRRDNAPQNSLSSRYSRETGQGFLPQNKCAGNQREYLTNMLSEVLRRDTLSQAGRPPCAAAKPNVEFPGPGWRQVFAVQRSSSLFGDAVSATRRPRSFERGVGRSASSSAGALCGIQTQAVASALLVPTTFIMARFRVRRRESRRRRAARRSPHRSSASRASLYSLTCTSTGCSTASTRRTSTTRLRAHPVPLIRGHVGGRTFAIRSWSSTGPSSTSIPLASSATWPRRPAWSRGRPRPPRSLGPSTRPRYQRRRAETPRKLRPGRAPAARRRRGRRAGRHTHGRRHQ